MSPELYLQLAILVPLIGAVGVRLTGQWPNVREGVSFVTAAILVFVCYNLYQSYTPDTKIEVVWLELLPGLTVSFSAEPLGLLFALMSSFLWLITGIYAIGYMRGHGEKNQTRFFQFFAITMATVMGVAFSDNLFTLYIFYELLTLSTYPLVTHAGNENAKRGGRTYLGILLSTSVLFLLLAIISTWVMQGSLDFVPGGLLAQSTASTTTLGVLLALFILGIGKAAIFPVHRWLPAAMVAPTPVSALLHAVAVVKGGVFTILKVCVYVFGLDTLNKLPATDWLLYLAGFSVFMASVIAMRQDNLKKRLAYSTVGQLGYVTIGALLANKMGIIGGAMHMAIHGFGKITLFFCAGAIMVVTHKKLVSELDGLGKQMPLTMAAFFIASLSIIGLPPAAGTWSKWFLMLGTIEAEQWLLMTVLGLSSMMNIFYLLSIPLKAFFYEPAQPAPAKAGPEAPLPILIAIGVCTVMCICPVCLPTTALRSGRGDCRLAQTLI